MNCSAAENPILNNEETEVRILANVDVEVDCTLNDNADDLADPVGALENSNSSSKIMDDITQITTLVNSSFLAVPEEKTSSKLLETVDINKKRENYLSWNDYFMAVAFLSAMRSKDPVTQVGACIVNKENKIVGIGYNGMPIGCSDDEFPWQKQSDNPIENKFLYVCHAELNSILNKIVGDLKDCRIYVAMFPCNECAKLIIQSGIREVIFLSNKNWKKVECTASKRMFDATGVTYTQYIPTLKKIVIDFEAIDWNEMSQMPTTPKK